MYIVADLIYIQQLIAAMGPKIRKSARRRPKELICEGKHTLGWLLGALAVHPVNEFGIYRPVYYCVDPCLFCVPLRDSTEPLRIVLMLLGALFFKDGANGLIPALLKVLVDGFASEVLQATGAAMIDASLRRMARMESTTSAWDVALSSSVCHVASISLSDKSASEGMARDLTLLLN